MPFKTSLELHFLSIRQTPAQIDVLVDCYKMEDGGLDIFGIQQYIRTVIVRRGYIVDATLNHGQLVNWGKTQLTAINAEFGLTFTLGDFICSL